MEEDRNLKKSMDEGRSLLNQLSSLKNERVVCLDSIKNLRNRVYEVCTFFTVDMINMWKVCIC